MQDCVDFRSVAKKGSFEEIYKKLVVKGCPDTKVVLNASIHTPK